MLILVQKHLHSAVVNDMEDFHVFTSLVILLHFHQSAWPPIFALLAFIDNFSVYDALASYNVFLLCGNFGALSPYKLFCKLWLIKIWEETFGSNGMLG